MGKRKRTEHLLSSERTLVGPQVTFCTAPRSLLGTPPTEVDTKMRISEGRSEPDPTVPATFSRTAASVAKLDDDALRKVLW